MQTVLNLKEALVKAGTDTERCRDILDRLANVAMNMEILTETLIGAAVNKLKSHKELGKTAKGLIKTWKKVAAAENNKPKSPPASAAAERRTVTSSTNGDNDDESSTGNYDPESEWVGLPDQRHSICTKLYEILLSAKPALLKQGVSPAAVVHLCAPRTAELERAMQKSFKGKAYGEKARSLCFNLKRNKDLAVSLLLGHVEPSELVRYTPEQLASDTIRKDREETAQKLIDSKRLDWDQANEEKINEQCGIKGDLLNASLFTCGRCKSTKTTSTQKQTRSADEPMTVFVLCLNCGKRWKC